MTQHMFLHIQAGRQREYLEKTVDTLKRKLAKDSELHRSDNLRIMQVSSGMFTSISPMHLSNCYDLFSGEHYSDQGDQRAAKRDSLLEGQGGREYICQQESGESLGQHNALRRPET